VTSQIAEEKLKEESGVTTDEWKDDFLPWARRLVEEGRHPMTVRFMVEAEDWDDDRLFDYGAERIPWTA
jgi:hypothetical protein